MNTATETLGALLQRYAIDNDEPRDVLRVRFDEAMRRGDDPLHTLPYLAGLGIQMRSTQKGAIPTSLRHLPRPSRRLLV